MKTRLNNRLKGAFHAGIVDRYQPQRGYSPFPPNLGSDRRRYIFSEARKGLTPRSFFNPKVGPSPPVPRQGASHTHYNQPWHAQQPSASQSKHQSLLGASDLRGTDDSLRASHTHERAES